MSGESETAREKVETFVQIIFYIYIHKNTHNVADELIRGEPVEDDTIS